MLAHVGRLAGRVGARTLARSCSTVPVIDLADSFAEDAGKQLQVAKQIGAACEKIGFFSIVNHSVPAQTIDNMWSATREFFDLPEAEKIESAKMTAEYPYGYSPIGGEILAKGKESGRADEDLPPVADLKESFSLGPSNPAAGMPPRQWPPRPTTFRPSWEAYYQAMEGLSGHILRLFSLALDLPPNWFEDKTDRHRSVIRALNYPDIESEPLPGQLRASAHTDYGTITILRPDDAPGGLQVLDKNNEWKSVAVPNDGYVINLGDLMARWTNDKWVSTMHRVVLPPKDRFGSCRRQSVAFFQNINADHMVECIPTCLDAGKQPKYPPITAFEHLMQKHRASVGMDK